MVALGPGVLVVSETKSGKVRRVPLSPELLREIRGRVGRLLPFKSTDSWRFNLQVRRLSGIKRFHAHMMRHTFGCWFLEQDGTSLPALQQVLGHATITTTQKYARLSDEVVKEQMQRAWRGQTVAETVAGGGAA